MILHMFMNFNLKFSAYEMKVPRLQDEMLGQRFDSQKMFIRFIFLFTILLASLDILKVTYLDFITRTIQHLYVS
jgi:hypothetical protein